MKKIILSLAGFFLACGFSFAEKKTLELTVDSLNESLGKVKASDVVELKIKDAAPSFDVLSSAILGHKVELDLSACSITEIPSKAFFMNENLSKIVLPSSVAKIGDKAFACTSISEINLPENCEIGDFAFSRTKLEKVQIPAGISKCGVGAFAENKNLKEIFVNPDNKILKDIDGVLYSKDELTLISYPAGKEDAEYKISEKVLSIGTDAFAFNEKISKVEMPKTLLRICGYAFRDCKSISEIEIPETVVAIGQDAFDGTSISTIKIPKLCIALGNTPFNNCEKLSEINVEEGNIAYYSEDGVLFSAKKEILRFPSAKADEEYTIPSEVKNVGNASFENVPTLKKLIVQDGVVSIGKYAFKNCSSLESVTGFKSNDLPESLSRIGRQAFMGSAVKNIPAYYVGIVDSYAPVDVDAK